MRLRLPKLYPLTDVRLSGMSHAEQVAAFCRGGATFVQLRDKDLSSDELYQEAKRALAVAKSFGAKLVINDRADVALAIGADGVHLGQDDMPPAAARAFLGPEALIGFSTHNLTQVREAGNLPIDYLAIGPVFSTTTKENPDAVVGVKGVKAARELVPGIALTAIGGITLQNAAEVLAAGADSVAVIAGLLSDSDLIEQRVQQFLAIT